MQDSTSEPQSDERVPEGGELRVALGGSALFAAATVFSRMLGMVREALAARYFGLSRDRDLYLVAHALAFQPVTVVVTVANAALLPVLAWAVREGEAAGIGGLAAVAIAVAPVLLAWAAGTAASAFRLGTWLVNENHPRHANLLGRLVRVCTWYVPLAGMGNVAAMLPLAAQRYILPAIAYAVPNIAVLSVFLVLQPRLAVVALALGDVAGGLLFFLIIASSICLTYRGLWRARLRWDLASRFAVLALPPMLQSLAAAFAVVLERSVVARLPRGTLSAYDYSYSLANMAVSALVAGPMTVVAALLAYEAGAQNRSLLTRRTEQMLMVVILITILGASVLLANAEETTRLVYQGRAFDEAATHLTAALLLWHAPPLLANSAADVLARVCNAMHDTFTPSATWVIGQALRIALLSPLSHRVGAPGAAVASLLGLLLSATILAVALHLRHIRVPWAAIAVRTSVLVALCALAAMVVSCLPKMPLPFVLAQATVLLSRAFLQTALFLALVFVFCPFERGLILAAIRRGRAVVPRPQKHNKR
jgi:putative peptidoglycan lipid II flippase